MMTTLTLWDLIDIITNRYNQYGLVIWIWPQVRNIFMEVYEDAQSPVEKRVAAYLMLMKSPDHALVTNILNNLENVRDKQLKSFVVSHLKNIHKSGETQMYQWVLASNISYLFISSRHIFTYVIK